MISWSLRLPGPGWANIAQLMCFEMKQQEQLLSFRPPGWWTISFAAGHDSYREWFGI
jgi:hypothetical protein